MRFRLLAVLVAALLLAAGAVWALRARKPVPPPSPRSPDVARPPAPAPPTAVPDETPRQPAAPPWFSTLSETGIDFHHQTGTNSEKPFPAANGSGLAALDFDLDGRVDLYFATGTPFPLDTPRSEPTNRIYRNLGSKRFRDVTVECGLGHAGYSAGLAVGDYDGDGFADVYVACYGANVLYHNRGDGTFAAVTPAAGVGDSRWATSAAFFDADGDGLLDLYVCNYAKWTWETRRWCGDRARDVRLYCSPHSVEPEDDVLYRNQGNGTFADATAASGVNRQAGRAQGVVAADVNGDGFCDLYVGNDLHANSLFLNDGSGQFRDATE